MGEYERTVDATLGALSAAQPKLQAMAVPVDAVARAEARHRDALASCGVHLGPLHGLPIVAKDIIDVAGFPTQAGSACRHAAAPADNDAAVVRQLRAAGAVVVAKSKTVEFAFGGWGTNDSQGTPKNPWSEVHHTPGGSSSGTGVLVGAGLVPAGLGTDTGGSVRIPAAFCGTVGLKTSVGLVSRAGVVPLSTSLDSVGPLSDTVRRSAEMLAAMQGEDPADPSTRGIPPVDPLAQLGRGLAGLRLGRVADDQLVTMTNDIADAFNQAANMLVAAGATLVPFRFPRGFLELQEFANRIIASEAYFHHQALVDDPASKLNAPTRNRMMTGRTMSARDRIEAERMQVADTADFLAAMDRLDALVLPTTPHPAVPLSSADENVYSTSLFTRFANYFTLAALAVPIGLTPAGLPTSLQIAVRRFDDPLALRIGAAFEAERGPFPPPKTFTSLLGEGA